MSWQVASFLVLAAVLLGGFAWYERSRPPAQVVALVAALAALAIAGRIAFAAFPNVKPTTDIVVFAGYALGGAPGFAVGALAALVSNFWFGQGPWTPWQMVGWGLCGMLGAALALATRNAGRLTLAAACALAGALYGALLNFSLMATYGGDLSWERYWLLASRAIPFDVAHVLGNVAFALLAGPAMVRMLTRFRERFEWGRGGTRVPATATVAALLALVLAWPAQAEASRVDRAAEWLVAQQNPDGGFGASPDSDSGPEITAWAMLGLAAADRHPLDVRRGGRTPVDFLRANLDELDRPGDLARTILALHAAGVDPRRFGGRNLVRQLLAERRQNGSYLGWPGSTAFAAIALRTAGATGGMTQTLGWLRSTQNEDGGWGDRPETGSTADGTGAVLQALSAGSRASKRGVSYLTGTQRAGGGFSLGGSGPVNTQSTAWAVQGILAAGRKPADFRRGGVSAPGYIAKLQRPDGHYRYSGASDQTPVWVTAQVLVAAAGERYPVAPPPRAPRSGAGGQEEGGPSGGRTEQRGGSGTTGGGAGSGAVPPAADQLPGPTRAGSGVAGPPIESAGGGTPGGGSATGAGGGGAPGPSSNGGGSSSGGPASGGDAAGAGPGISLDDLTLRERGADAQRDGEDAAQPAAADSSEDGSSSALGAIALGLLAGGLLAGAGLVARRGWMRWRYGV